MADRIRTSMPCPKCGGRALVQDTYRTKFEIKRIRICDTCHYRFTTIEIVIHKPKTL
jgi:transcriptional regulator NrdR family protein